MDYVIASLDTAYTEKTENDMSALTVWGIFSSDTIAQPTKRVARNGTLYDEAINVGRSFAEQHPKLVMINAWAERLPLHELVNKVAMTCKNMRVDLLLIEGKASGISVAQELRRLYGGEDFGVQLINPGAQDKMARLYSVQHLFAEGMIFAPDRAWADRVITQCAQFPRAKHDDLVDTVSQALRHLRTSGLLTRSSEHLQQIEESNRVKPQVRPLYEV
jgi:predicted phage terminase large subunit-like protein